MVKLILLIDSQFTKRNLTPAPNHLASGFIDRHLLRDGLTALQLWHIQRLGYALALELLLLASGQFQRRFKIVFAVNDQIAAT